jgi:AraC family transcriptional regulator of adaptative response / DNA-3-methyladenine glycosylase II
LARFAAEGGFQRSGRGEDLDEFVRALSQIEGIGPWTAHYVAMRVLRHPDAFPAGDLGLRKAAAALEGSAVPLTQRMLDARALQWRPWRAYAAAYLWNSLRKNPTC